MSILGRLGIAILSFTFPGLGHGLMHRRRAMFLWIAATFFGALLGLVVAMGVFVGLGVMIASAVMAFIQIGPPRIETRAPLTPAVVEGHDAETARPKWNKSLAVLAAVLWLVGGAALSAVLGTMRLPSTSMEPTLHIDDHVTIDKLTYRLRLPRRGELIIFANPCRPEAAYLKRLIATAGDTVEVRCNVVYLNGKALQTELVDSQTCEYKDHDFDNRSFTRSCSRYRETVNGVGYDIYHDVDRPLRDERLTGGGVLQGDERDFPRVDSEAPPSCAENGSPGAGHAVGAIVRTIDTTTATACQAQLHYVVPEGHVFVMGDNRANSNDSRYWGSVPLENVSARVVGRWWF